MSKGAIAFQKKFMAFVGLVCAVLFIPTSMILVFGMMPTIASNLVDRTAQRSRTVCVGMMNFVGVMPFLLELWMSPAPNAIDHATEIMLQPKALIIMYALAGSGYAIEAAISGIVATVMQQQARARLKVIDATLEELQARWGDYVDGGVPLDDYGFPILDEDD